MYKEIAKIELLNKKLSEGDKFIIERLKELMSRESEIINESIELLDQIDKRKIFLLMGYPSLFEFCVQELKYSETSAYRRISAVRLFRDVPEIKEKVTTGEVSLSAITQAQTFFGRRAKDNRPLLKEEKLHLLGKLENKNIRECEKEILKVDPKAHKPDRAYQVTNELTELRLTVDSEFISTLNRLRARLSIRGLLETKDVLFHALKSELTRLDRNPKELSLVTQLAKNNDLSQRGRIIIPRSLRALVYTKSGGECSYVDPFSKRKCKGRHFLEIDHIVPLYRGGTNNLNNLQLMCSGHNQLKGVSLMEVQPTIE
jgi:hypothetical protein